MGKRILFLVILAVLSGHFAVAQTDSLVRYGDSLHRAYDFAEAESVYLQVLDSLSFVSDFNGIVICQSVSNFCLNVAGEIVVAISRKHI